MSSKQLFLDFDFKYSKTATVSKNLSPNYKERDSLKMPIMSFEEINKMTTY